MPARLATRETDSLIEPSKGNMIHACMTALCQYQGIQALIWFAFFPSGAFVKAWEQGRDQ